MSRNTHRKKQLTHFAEMVWVAPAKAADAAPAVGAAGAALARVAGALVAPLVAIYRRRRLYEELAEMDGRLLADIGIERADIPRVVEGAYRDDAGAAHTPRRAALSRSAGATT